jgi:hypothetical protein
VQDDRAHAFSREIVLLRNIEGPGYLRHRLPFEAAIILFSTWSLLRDSLNLALDKVPEGVDTGKVLAYLAALPYVTEVHDLHFWPVKHD